MSSRRDRDKVIGIFVLVVWALLHTYANCATSEQRALIRELELAALAIFIAVTLVQNKIKFGVYLSRAKKEISAEALAPTADLQALFALF